MTQRTVAIAEPAFASHNGHYSVAIGTLVDALARRGIKAHVFGSAAMTRDVITELEARGAAVTPLFRAESVWRLRARVLTFPTLSLVYADGLRRIRRVLGPATPVITYSGRAEFLLGATIGTSDSCGPTAMQFFAWDLRPKRTPLLVYALEQLAGRLTRSRSDRIVLTAQNQPCAADLHARTGAEIPITPLLIDWSAGPPRAPNPGADVTVGYLGGARMEKGFIDFVDAMCGSLRDVQVVAHAHIIPGERTPPMLAAAARLAARPNTTVIDETVSYDRYIELMKLLDIIVLPYDPRFYRIRTSNIVAEALGFGVHPLVRDGTWAASFCREVGAGTTYKGDARALESAVEALVSAGAPGVSSATSDLVRQRMSADGWLDVVLPLLDR